MSDVELSADRRWTLRKSVEGHEAYLSGGALYALADTAVSDYSLGSLEHRRTEVKLVTPSAGEHICPAGADTIYVATSKLSLFELC